MLVSESDLPRGSEWKVQDETAKTGISDIYFSIQQKSDRQTARFLSGGKKFLFI